MIKTKLGAPLSPKDLHNIDPKNTTPQYELYEDDLETHKHVSDVTDDINPETGDHYIGAEVSLPCGGTQQSNSMIWKGCTACKGS